MLNVRFFPLRWGALCCLAVMLMGWPTAGLAGPYSDGISDGIAYDDPGILAWASGCTGFRPSYATFGQWSDAVGPSPGVSNHVVSLGDAGYAVLTFDIVIADGPGADFAVFENSLKVGSNVFAELGYVEVSSDGQNFVRFASHSLTANPVGTFSLIDPTDVHNLAGKHVSNEGLWLGTPFDLADLLDEPPVQSGLVDLSGITTVKIIDVIGDGSTFDGQGNPIYDPYPTDFEAGGFDLDALAVLNTAELPGDVNGDGFVGADDLVTILTNWDLSDQTWEQGDLTGEGFVGADDYVEVLTHWNSGNGSEPAAVPEPTALATWLALGIGSLWGRVRRKV